MTTDDFADFFTFVQTNVKQAKAVLEARAPRLAQRVGRVEFRLKHACRLLRMATDSWIKPALKSVVVHSRRAGLLASHLFDVTVVLIAVLASARSRPVLWLRAMTARVALAREQIQYKVRLKPILWAVEASLWILAAGTFGYCSYAYSSAAQLQRREKAIFSELEAREANEASFLSSAALVGSPDPGKLLGILDIPRIGLSSIVEQGADSTTLRESVGHIPGTALPGGNGNAALAAHRDTYFRHLSELHRGDEVIFRSLSGTYSYTVQSTRVIEPTDMKVLAATPKPTLTLVTCYPFYYVGNAPKRFVVVATEDPTSP